MFRRGAREAVRALLVFHTDCADLHRCRSGAACFPTDRADLHRCRSGRANPTDRAQARQMPQMPFGVFLVFPQIAQICTDARSGRFLFSTQIAPLAPRCKREFCYNVTCYMLQLGGAILRRMSFKKLYSIYIIYIIYILYNFYTPQIQTSERRCRHTEGAYCNM